MGKWIEQLGQQLGNQVGGGIIGAGMGLLMQKQNDRRQMEMQEKLNELQIKGQEHMTDYSYKKQMEMWKNTNYAAQMAELQKAGLNPGLMYGMGGGGGTTTGVGSGSVTGGVAPSGGGEIPTMMGMGMQLQLLKAQKENIEANTAKTKAEASKTAVDENLSAMNVSKTGTEWEILLKNEQILTRTLESQIEKITGEGQSAWTKGKVDTTTVNEQIDQKVNEAIQTSLKNANISQDTANKIIEIAQGWKHLSLEERKVQVQEQLAGGQLENKDQDQIINVINAIVGILSRGRIGGGGMGTEWYKVDADGNESHGGSWRSKKKN